MTGAFCVDGEFIQGVYIDTALLHSQLRSNDDGRGRDANIAAALDIIRRRIDAGIEGRGAFDVVQAVAACFGLKRADVEAWEDAAAKPIAQFNEPDLRNWAPVGMRPRSLFSGNLDTRSTEYLKELVDNDVAGVLHQFDPSYAPALSREAFEQRHGEPPWTGMNRALEALGLPHRFDFPDHSPLVAKRFGRDVPDWVKSGGMRLELRNEAGMPVGIDGLSTGEQTTLALASALYATSLSRVAADPIQLLALDEVDAGLHPSAIRVLVRFIQEEFVDRLGMHVIMSTHAPTTVALSPPDSVWVADPKASPQLRNVSTDEALSRLLVGVPTLSVKSENRRVVITESLNDARWYQQIFTILEPELQSELSLSFIPAGGNDNKGVNGCDRVISLVTELREAGNLSVWGLVDRDSRDDLPTWVHSSVERYSIENFVLDPLSIALHLLRAHAQTPHGLSGLSEHDIRNGTSLQAAVDAVASRCSREGDDLTPKIVGYRGGGHSEIPSFWLTIQGHELDARVRDAWPMLRQHNQKLLDAIVQGVWATFPEYIPENLSDTIADLVAVRT